MNLRHTSPKAETEDDEDEDEEAAVLIPSDTYDGLICAGCVQRHPFVRDRAGKDGWMVIEPDESGSSWKVVGRRTSEEEKKPDVQQEEVIADGKPGPGGLPETVKRPVEDGGEERDAKRSRLEEGGTAGALVEEGVVKSESTAVPGKPILQGERSSKGAGDVFLSYGIRDQLKASLDVSGCLSLIKLRSSGIRRERLRVYRSRWMMPRPMNRPKTTTRVSGSPQSQYGCAEDSCR